MFKETIEEMWQQDILLPNTSCYMELLTQCVALKNFTPCSAIKDFVSCHYSFVNVECFRHSPQCSLLHMIKSFIEVYEVAVRFYFVFSVFSV